MKKLSLSLLAALTVALSLPAVAGYANLQSCQQRMTPSGGTQFVGTYRTDKGQTVIVVTPDYCAFSVWVNE